jgi:polysaccharide biosynthesis/export protein
VIASPTEASCDSSPPQGRSRTTKLPASHPRLHALARLAPGALAFFFSIVLVAAASFPSSAFAQSAAELKQKAAQAGITSEDEALRKAKAAGMTREQILQALREAGYTETDVRGLLGEELSIPPTSGTPVVTPPSSLPDSQLTAPPMAPPQRATLAPEDYPEFTKEIAQRVPNSPPVLPFGYEIFGYVPSTFEPLAAGPVDPEYPIGPGDEVIVQVWGDNEFTHASVVSREATITVPDIGQVVLNGLTLAQAKRLITDRLAAVYSGIRSRRPSTYVDVTLGKLRTIQVFILGDVVRPGGYTISSVSTVLNALYNAGGPTPRGSMRDVRIIRHNEIWKQVDLYGYILTGSKAEDVRLQTGDVVFIPPIGKTAAVLGEVHRSAIYELKEGEGFRDLLSLAGGVQSTAVIDRALVDRVVPFEERASHQGEDRIAIDVPLREILADSTRNPSVVDRDIVQVFRVGETRKNTVTISGAPVMRPGTFQIRPGMKISDLIAEAGGLKPDAYLERGTLVRTAADRTRSIRPFNVREAMAHEADDDYELQKLDEITIRSIWEIQERHTVAIHGSVREPGTYEYLDGMTVMDLIFRAGGLRESAYKMEAEVARIDSSTIAMKQSADVYRVGISGDYSIHSPDTTFALQKMDQVFIRELPDWQMQRNVKVSGEVQYPGVYSLRAKDERLSSVLGRAGGLKPTSYPRAAVFVRRKGGAGRLAVDVESVVRKNKSRYDLVLEDGDSLHIPREPRTVKVVGEVGFPASVLYEKGKSLSHYIQQAGGYTDDSDKKRVKVLQPSGRVEPAKKMWWDPDPQAGSLVIVPRKPPSQNKETLKDVATIMSIITGAVTTIFVVSEATD